MNRRGFVKAASGIAILFSTPFTSAYASLRRLYSAESVNPEGLTGVSLRDIKLDEYGRVLVKNRGNRDTELLAADSPQPDQTDTGSAASESDKAPNLICPCPTPPPPPPVPDLICPCPTPPPPPPV
jgi:hypothetical protein